MPQCTFCPEPATTGEHLWSNWVNPLLGKNRRYIIRQRVQGNERNWESVGLHLKFPVLCDPCNNEWGSDIETRMKNVSAGMVRDGEPTLLSASDVATIAIYSQLKAFICDYGQDQVPLFYASQERRAFRADFTLPPGVNMWLARTPGTHGIFNGAYAKPPLETPKRFHIYVFMVSIGQLVIQVTSARWTKKSNRKYAAPPNLTQASFWDRFSIPIWPNCVETGSLSAIFAEPGMRSPRPRACPGWCSMIFAVRLSGT